MYNNCLIILILIGYYVSAIQCCRFNISPAKKGKAYVLHMMIHFFFIKICLDILGELFLRAFIRIFVYRPNTNEINFRYLIAMQDI